MCGIAFASRLHGLQFMYESEEGLLEHHVENGQGVDLHDRAWDGGSRSCYVITKHHDDRVRKRSCAAEKGTTRRDEKTDLSGVVICSL